MRYAVSLVAVDSKGDHCPPATGSHEQDNSLDHTGALGPRVMACCNNKLFQSPLAATNLFTDGLLNERPTIGLHADSTFVFFVGALNKLRNLRRPVHRVSALDQAIPVCCTWHAASFT